MTDMQAMMVRTTNRGYVLTTLKDPEDNIMFAQYVGFGESE